MAEPHEHSHEEMWRALLTGTNPDLHRIRRWHRLLPHNPRCKVCSAPFAGLGGLILRARGKGPSRKNPNFCNT
jgi:adenylate cyclase